MEDEEKEEKADALVESSMALATAYREVLSGTQEIVHTMPVPWILLMAVLTVVACPVWMALGLVLVPALTVVVVVICLSEVTDRAFGWTE